jgi:hypothetical protein
MGHGPLGGRQQKTLQTGSYLVLSGCSSLGLGIHNSDEFSLNSIKWAHHAITMAKENLAFLGSQERSHRCGKRARLQRVGKGGQLGLACAQAHALSVWRRGDICRRAVFLGGFLIWNGKEQAFKTAGEPFFLPALSGLQETFP